MFERGFVSYSNRAKQEMLGVTGDLIADLGAVSEPIVRMMAEGALENSHAHISVAITGVAGPGGGTPMKPVGTVHFATARANQSLYHRQEFFELEASPARRHPDADRCRDPEAARRASRRSPLAEMLLRVPASTALRDGRA